MRQIRDPEQMLQDEMVQRIERAAEELHAALTAMCDVIVSTPQEGESHSWRWRFGNAKSQALHRVNDSRWRS